MTNEVGIAITPNEVTEGHVNIEAQFYYQGSHSEAILRKGRIEKVTADLITLELQEGGFKSFKKDLITPASVFLFT